MSTALATPSASAMSTSIQTWMAPVTTSRKTMIARIIFATCVAIRSRRLGHESAMTPANRPNTRTGMNWARDDDAQPDRVVGQRQDEPRLGHLLHPRADERDRLAGEEQPVVAMAEGAQPADRGRVEAHRGASGPRASCAERAARSPWAIGAAVELGEVRFEVVPALRRLIDHRRQALGLVAEDLDLALGAAEGLAQEPTALGRVVRGAIASTHGSAGRPRPRAAGGSRRGRTRRRRAVP